MSSFGTFGRVIDKFVTCIPIHVIIIIQYYDLHKYSKKAFIAKSSFTISHYNIIGCSPIFTRCPASSLRRCRQREVLFRRNANNFSKNNYSNAAKSR